MSETPTPPVQPTTPAQPTAVVQPKQGNGLAVAGMVLGIISLALFCIWYVSFPCAVTGLILSIVGLGKSKQTGAGGGMAKAGLVLSLIALSLAMIIIILVLVGIAFLPWQQVEESARTFAEFGSNIL